MQAPAGGTEVPHRATLIEQHYDWYTDEDHAVWALLYERRMRELRQNGCEFFLRGARRIGLRPDRVPVLAEVNERLEPLTGWRAVPVSGFLPAAEFFHCLAERRFPTTITVRPRAQLDYLEQPDIFHDVFGHVPLHADPVFADFLQRFGALASAASTDAETEAMARLFWFTVEFGLIRERGHIKLYGSGLISSAADAANALSARCQHRPFTLEAVEAQPFEIDHLQDVLFVIESFEDLYEALSRRQ
ncbi:MAG: phenylalanine 4-monooxygenase [Gemmatimonadota bacterium]|nr:phenylalanine 4-monooxygenase [Gemmatimonadota bacterium]